MALYNASQPIGVIIDAFTNNITGSLFLTLLIITILFMAIAFLFRMPLEITAPLILPLHLISMAHTSEYVAVGGSFLIYIAIIFVRMFFLR